MSSLNSNKENMHAIENNINSVFSIHILEIFLIINFVRVSLKI